MPLQCVQRSRPMANSSTDKPPGMSRAAQLIPVNEHESNNPSVYFNHFLRTATDGLPENDL